jgi:predicted dehydrogenase
MNTTQPVRVAIIGCGNMARAHLRWMLQQQATTQIAAVCEPNPEAYATTAELFSAAGLAAPPNQPVLEQLLSDYADGLDAALIVTPHACHHDQARACLEAGLDVLLEKPMVMNATEARGLIETRDRTGRLLVVAFNGSLSPQIRKAVDLLRSGELGEILGISGAVWQNWGPGTVGKWRQQPEVSGGGFLFDTGAHLLNTVADLAGEDFVEVAAWLDQRARPVDVLAAVMGRLESGTMVTLHGCGETIRTCSSDIRVFCSKAILYTDAWGRWLKLQRDGRKHFRTVKVPASLGAWEQFLAVRAGRIANPCPPEVGLRMARLWDAIQVSAQQGGIPVQCVAP